MQQKLRMQHKDAQRCNTTGGAQTRPLVGERALRKATEKEQSSANTKATARVLKLREFSLTHDAQPCWKGVLATKNATKPGSSAPSRSCSSVAAGKKSGGLWQKLGRHKSYTGVLTHLTTHSQVARSDGRAKRTAPAR